MGSFSSYIQKALLDHLLMNTPYVPPTALYVALYTIAPTAVGGGNEVSGSGYARMPVSYAPATQGLETSTHNVALINFPVPTAAWGTLVAYAVFDALTAGHMLFFGELGIPKSVSMNDEVTILANGLMLSLV